MRKEVFALIIILSLLPLVSSEIQVIKKIDLAFNTQSIIPGNPLAYAPLLYDQAGAEAKQEVDITIYNPKNKIIANRVVTSGDTALFETQGNSMPGEWKVEAKSNGLTATKSFNIEKLQNASFQLVSQTLRIKNTGNVPYNKQIEITIGDTTETKEVSIGLGEMKILELSAPNGEYSIKVNDGIENKAIGTAMLTGRAISVKDMSELAKANYWIIPLVIIILIVIFLVLAYHKKKKNEGYHAIPLSERVSLPLKLNTSQENKPIRLNLYSSSQSTMENKPKITPNPSISLLNTNSKNIIDNGEKQEVAVIALKIRNIGEVDDSDSNAGDAIENALSIAKSARAKVYNNGSFKVCIFSQRVTKNPENFLLAVKTAKNISDALSNHNRKFAHRVDFGIAAGKGLMIVESNAGEFKFTSVGNTTVVVKNAAEKSNGELLITEELQRRVMGSVKGDKIPGTNLWKVNSIIDRTQHSDFISNFVRRNKGE